MEFQQDLNNKTKYIETILAGYLPEVTGNQQLILEAMEYSLMAGGKRIRPLILLESYRMLTSASMNAIPAQVTAFMAAIEMIHTYSLVHDDLPAMDDDDYRRGRETTHRVYGEDMGILAGDGLLNYAFEVAHGAVEAVLSRESIEAAIKGSNSVNIAPVSDIMKDNESLELEGMNELDKALFMAEDKLKNILAINKSLQVLSKKAGVHGMIGGQVIDVKSSGTAISREVLDEIFVLKTGALIEASFMIGGLLAEGEQSLVAELEEVGHGVGMAFQIQDDILDVISTADELGKPIGSDVKNEKTTYVTLLGLEGAKEQVELHSRRAITLLRDMPGDSRFLESLVEMLIYRKR